MAIATAVLVVGYLILSRGSSDDGGETDGLNALGTTAATTTAPADTSVPPSSTEVPATTTAVDTSPAVDTPSPPAPASAGEPSGGAYGFLASVSLFGGPPITYGPEPQVELPAGGSATPVAATAPSGRAQFGPARLFDSSQLDASTEGTPTAGVTSSAAVQNYNQVEGATLGAQAVRTHCRATAAGASGSSVLAGAKVTVSVGADADVVADDVVIDIPAEPAPNTVYEGKIEHVGDHFRVVANEQIIDGGSITVNALHLYLLGPIAVGDLIVGQARCGFTP